ncbi:MAG: diacylglycerol kinase [Christensenellales bacterium]
MGRSVKRYGKWYLCALLVLIFLMLALSLEGLLSLDRQVSGAVSALRSPLLTPVMLVFTQAASPLLLVMGSLVIIFLVRQQQYWAPIFSNLALSVFLNLGLKDLFVRSRPDTVTQLVAESGYSFPSGHSMAAMSFYGFLIYLLWRSRLRRLYKDLLTGLLAVLIALVGFSRVYLGVHYPSDVLAGYSAAAAYLIVFTAFVDAFFRQDRSVASGLAAGRHPRFAYSFAHALDGIIAGLKAERNMIIHFGVMALVIVFAFLLRCSPLEWCVLFAFFGLVIATELINTAIEAAVDLVTSEIKPGAKLAKDTAAGAVLISAACAATAGAIIFLPKLLRLVRQGL